MGIDESEFKIITHGDKKYIAGTHVKKYQKKRSGNPFVGAEQRTIRIYKDEGIVLDSRKSGRDTYFELEDTYFTLMIVYYLNFREFDKEKVKSIVFKAREHGQLPLYEKFLEVVFSRKIMNMVERESLLDFLTKVETLNLETTDPAYREFLEAALTK